MPPINYPFIFIIITVFIGGSTILLRRKIHSIEDVIEDTWVVDDVMVVDVVVVDTIDDHVRSSMVARLDHQC